MLPLISINQAFLLVTDQQEEVHALNQMGEINLFLSGIEGDLVYTVTCDIRLLPWRGSVGIQPLKNVDFYSFVIIIAILTTAENCCLFLLWILLWRGKNPGWVMFGES